MHRLEREYTPERPGDELRALNRGDDGNTLRFLDIPDKSGMRSNASSSSDFLREDTSPIFPPGGGHARQAVSIFQSNLQLKKYLC
jgi:hypothetical protein